MSILGRAGISMSRGVCTCAQLPNVSKLAPIACRCQSRSIVPLVALLDMQVAALPEGSDILVQVVECRAESGRLTVGSFLCPSYTSELPLYVASAVADCLTTRNVQHGCKRPPGFLVEYIIVTDGASTWPQCSLLPLLLTQSILMLLTTMCVCKISPTAIFPGSPFGTCLRFKRRSCSAGATRPQVGTSRTRWSLWHTWHVRIYHSYGHLV